MFFVPEKLWREGGLVPPPLFETVCTVSNSPQGGARSYDRALLIERTIVVDFHDSCFAHDPALGRQRASLC